MNYPKKHAYTIFVGLILLIIISLLSVLDLSSYPKQIDYTTVIPLDIALEDKEIEDKIDLIVKKETTIKRNDSLFSILKRLGVKENNIIQLVNSENSRLLSTIKIDKKIELSINPNNEVVSLNYIKNYNSGVQAIKKGETYSIKEYLLKTEKFRVFKQVMINSSLYLDGIREGLPDSVIMDLVYIFGWDIDFVHDIRPGDSYSLIYEEVFVGGEKKLNGDILIAEFINQKRPHISIRYKLKNEISEYFSPSGRNVKKAFLRNPVKLSFISSRYNLKRKHPVLHTIRSHKGVDYAAIRGSPVIATGDGTVSFAKFNGGCGNEIKIKHSEDYSTRYCHLERYHPRTKEGKKIKQGQTIGYVGSTGLVTGPHLHYEFHVNGKHTDPLRVKFPNAKPINENEKIEYLQYSNKLISSLRNYQTLTNTYGAN